MESNEQLLLTLNRIDEYLARVDNKANFWMSFNTFIIGGIFLSRDKLMGIEAANVYFQYTFALLSGIAVVMAFVSLISSFVATTAFLKSGNTCEGTSSKYVTLFFFGSIAKLSKAEYLQRVQSSSTESLKEDLANQVHLLSNALAEKFKWINRSKDFSAISLIAVFLLVMQSIVTYK